MNIGNFFFKYRSYTPIPLAAVILYNAQHANAYLVLGLVCIILGESIRFWSVSYAGGITRTTTVGATTLCTAGPFAHTRNPLYIGNMLMYNGIVLIAGASNIFSILMLTWLFFIIQYFLIINLEEQTYRRTNRILKFVFSIRSLFPTATQKTKMRSPQVGKSTTLHSHKDSQD